MGTELNASLGYRKNQKGDTVSFIKGDRHSMKILKSQYGGQTEVPRDRNGEFESKLIPKYQRDIFGIEDKVISLFGRGLSNRDNCDQHTRTLWLELFAEMFGKVTNRIFPGIKEWQPHPFNPTYNVPTETASLAELEAVKEKWGKEYPYAVSNWEDTSSSSRFPGDIRRRMYITNIIERPNHQYWKVKKTKSVFPSDGTLGKMLYLERLTPYL